MIQQVCCDNLNHINRFIGHQLFPNTASNGVYTSMATKRLFWPGANQPWKRPMIDQVWGELSRHDDVIKWKQALMFSLIYAWINDWVNSREAGDLRRQHGHYDVIVMGGHISCSHAQWMPVIYHPEFCYCLKAPDIHTPMDFYHRYDEYANTKMWTYVSLVPEKCTSNYPCGVLKVILMTDIFPIPL